MSNLQYLEDHAMVYWHYVSDGRVLRNAPCKLVILIIFTVL